ncbi:MAG: two-component system response regulator VanR [Sulfurimonas sp.]
MLKKINSLLYVEDDDEVRENIADYFYHNIKNVYLAKDGVEGLELFEKHRPQVVITDIAMPNLNGIKLSKKIRDISNDTQLIITTSFDDKEYLIEAVNLQLLNYVLKPLTITKLENILKMCESKIANIVDENKYFSSDTYFDVVKKELIKNQEIVTLTLKSRDLLELLIKNYPSPTSYEAVYLNLYNGIENKDAVKTLIKILRKKIFNTSIETIYAYGYKLHYFKN